jgi:Asp-tRNA(Asn)/Glu-tRNA(Gln) amidotransferase A subunit family amidase
LPPSPPTTTPPPSSASNPKPRCWTKPRRSKPPAPTDKPLYGLIFAVKDNIDAAGLPTTAACPDFAYTPEGSAFVVARLEAAGAIVLGKTNLDQFATGLVGVRSPYGVPRNVQRADLVPGGSSSGSAVAVAAGIVDFALGTDTAGSGRIPAGMNGIVGLKPSLGLFSASRHGAGLPHPRHHLGLCPRRRYCLPRQHGGRSL